MQEFLDLEICPVCGGNGILEEEAGGLYIMCLECGCHSVSVDFNSEDEKLDAAKKTAELWNMGKVITGTPNESLSRLCKFDILCPCGKGFSRGHFCAKKFVKNMPISKGNMYF